MVPEDEQASSLVSLTRVQMMSIVSLSCIIYIFF